jgi:hypothetical protein
MNYYFPLTIPFKFNLKLPDIDLNDGQKMHFELDNLIPIEFKKYLSDTFNLNITKSLLFQQLPKTECNIHLDGIPGIQTRSAALNFILNSENTYMAWYDILKPSKTYNVYIDNLVVAHYNEDQVEEKMRVQLTDFNLVRTDVPHKVVNNSDKIRWCLSMRFDVNKNFEEFIDIFKNFERL